MKYLFLLAVILTGCSTTSPNWVDRNLATPTTNSVGQLVIAPNPAVDAVGAAAAAFPPWGGVVGAALLGALGVYREVRNRSIARSLVSGIEASRELIRTTNPDLDAQVVDTLISHQQAAGSQEAVGKLVANVTK